MRVVDGRVEVVHASGGEVGGLDTGGVEATAPPVGARGPLPTSRSGEALERDCPGPRGEEPLDDALSAADGVGWGNARDELAAPPTASRVADRLEEV